MVFVAVDDAGAATTVPPWDPPGSVLRAAQVDAQRRVALREKVMALVAAQDWTGETAAHAETLRFLAAPTDVNWGGKVHGGTMVAAPASSTATKTIRHWKACSTRPPRGLPEATSTAIVTLDRPVRTSWADTSTRSPTWMGREKSILPTYAVTQ